jgi:tRNA pseudouridine55 synthase
MRPDRPKPPLHGILLIDKPPGWTSHDVVAKTRGLTHQRKIGHTGTLDPMATGLLVLCLGDATRLVEYMSRHDKSYEGLITLGVTTDTDDSEGTPTGQGPVPVITAEELAGLEARFTGELLQRPPAYSAVKVAGKRAYAVARGGGTVELAERPVRVHGLRLRLVAPDRLAVSVRCGPGTYIRSLARDIGEILGCGAHLSALRRTRVGVFDVDGACSLEDVAAVSSAERLDELLLQPDEGVPELATAIVSDANAARLWHGRVIDVAPMDPLPDGPGRIYSVSGTFVGIGDFDAFGQLRPTKVVTNRG